MSTSAAWKALERDVAARLKARRFPRWLNFGQSAPDVIDVENFPELVIDAKLRQRWAHHALLRTVKQKYCQQSGQVPVLVSRVTGKPGAVVCLPLDYFARLLDELRAARDEANCDRSDKGTVA